MPNFSIPLSGLTAASQALAVISNNLANLNTVGFKESRASFTDLFYQAFGTNGANDPIQVGEGVALGSVTPTFTGGNLEGTGVPSDVAITGNGLFVTEKNGVSQYTRAGNFTVDSQGQLTTQDGQLVMGYPAVNGVISPSQTLAPLMINQGQLIPGAPTTALQTQTNLDASSAVGTSFSTPVTVFDSLGTSHVLTYQFTKTGSNAWGYQLTLPAADTGGTGAPTVVATGNLTFNPDGTLATPAAPVTGIAIAGLADGAANMTMTWNLQDAGGNSLLTQSAAPSATANTFQNGYGSGTLSDYSINSDGTIEGSFTNNQTLALGQIVLANFANPQGLLRVGQNSFQTTLSSGAPAIGTAGSGGRGTLTGGSLEQSNVDIATEFSNMIITQRGYQANARVVTTFDQLTQDTINMKQL
ncbi:MAG: flagellar hook protein FlgE [Terriglobales bacterium]|jgi:flagellar hook protein FlgE|nr:flagellar hook protein FlgE [Terriglobales bacterium]